MKVPPHLDWVVWRPVVAGIATLHEIEEHWSLTDLLDANEAMDLQARAEWEAMPKVDR